MADITTEEVETIRIRVAERLGWRTLEYSQSSLLVGYPPGKKRLCAVPSYARDIRAAWEIIDLLTCLQIRVCIINETLRGYIRNYYVEIGEKENILGQAGNRAASLAICLAFLKIPESRLRDVRQDSHRGKPGDAENTDLTIQTQSGVG